MGTIDDILYSKYRDLLVSLPMEISWLDYIHSFINLKVEADYFKIQLSGTPKTRAEKKCYLVYNDEIKGWMYINKIDTENNMTTLSLIPYLYPFEQKIKILPFTGFKYFLNLPMNEIQ